MSTKAKAAIKEHVKKREKKMLGKTAPKELPPGLIVLDEDEMFLLLAKALNRKEKAFG